MTYGKYIALTLLLLSGLKAWTQSVPWRMVPTGSNHTLFIKTSVNPLIDGTPLELGDAIGVFYDSAGKFACAGYTVWNNTSTFITAYGADGINEGLKQNELFKFRIWKKASDCVISHVTATYVTGGVVANTNRYVENGISEVSTLEGENVLKAGNFRVQTTWATCIAGGKILIERTGQEPISDLHFVARDVLTGDAFSSSIQEIVELPEAEYGLTITTEGCAMEWPDKLLISKDSNCNFPVISPNKDGVAEDYYIPYQGTTKIYDRNGELMIQLPTPSTWDATDSSGQLLPMGTYVIICEGYQDIMITIIR